MFDVYHYHIFGNITKRSRRTITLWVEINEMHTMLVVGSIFGSLVNRTIFHHEVRLSYLVDLELIVVHDLGHCQITVLSIFCFHLEQA